MTGIASTILDVWARVSPGGLLELGAACLVAVCLHVLHQRFRSKGAAGVLALCKWLAALAALRILDIRVLQGVWETPVLVLYGVFIWMAFRAILHDLYADLYVSRIKRRPLNHIQLNLMSFVAVIVLVCYGLRSFLNVDVGSLLTSSAILTAVIGFSMQDTIGSLFSGLLIQTEKPFKIGDWIKLGEQEGQVAEITWRYTKLVTYYNNQILIPNNAIVKDRLVNLSAPIPLVDVQVTVPAPVGAAPVKVKSALEDVLRKTPLVAATPRPTVRLSEIGLDRLSYSLSFYVNDFKETKAARSEVLSGVWYEFKRRGIEIPMNRRMLVSGRKAAGAAAESVLPLVGGIGLFAGMRPEELELLVDCAAVRDFPPEAPIVERGQSGETMFIIIEGEVAVSQDGHELSRLGPGEVFGEMALLTGEPRLADVTSIGPVSCLEVDREAFRGVLDKNPILVANVTRVFQERESKMRDSAHAEGPESAEGLFERFRRIFW